MAGLLKTDWFKKIIIIINHRKTKEKQINSRFVFH